jgi:hypothetical protein
MKNGFTEDHINGLLRYIEPGHPDFIKLYGFNPRKKFWFRFNGISELRCSGLGDIKCIVHKIP